MDEIYLPKSKTILILTRQLALKRVAILFLHLKEYFKYISSISNIFKDSFRSMNPIWIHSVTIKKEFKKQKSLSIVWNNFHAQYIFSGSGIQYQGPLHLKWLSAFVGCHVITSLRYNQENITLNQLRIFHGTGMLKSMPNFNKHNTSLNDRGQVMKFN